MKKRNSLRPLVLVLALMFVLCACGDAASEAPSDRIEAEAPEYTGTGTAITTEPVKTDAPFIRTEPKAPGDYPDNILMRQTFRSNTRSIDNDGSTDAVFGNSEIEHQDVTSVTFLDTLSGMPESAWDVSEAQNGSVMAWLENGTDLFVAGEGGVTASTCARMFSGFKNMTSINFNDCFYTELSTDMEEMFFRCWSLDSLDLSCFSTPVMEDTSYMFFDCELTELDLSSFDTSKVTNMTAMFDNCAEMTVLNISSFDTSSVINMSGMFSFCSMLQSLDLRHFDTSNVEDFGAMFQGCAFLQTLDISSFDTGKAVMLGFMFSDCQMLKSLDLSHFDTSNVTEMGRMFKGCNNLRTLDLSGFDFSSVNYAREMFAYCHRLESINCTITLPEGCIADDMYLNSGLE